MEYFRGGAFVICDEATYEAQYKPLGYIPYSEKPSEPNEEVEELPKRGRRKA